MIAALNIGLSLISRICDSKDISSVGVGTNSSDSNAMERLTIKSQEVGKKKISVLVVVFYATQINLPKQV